MKVTKKTAAKMVGIGRTTFYRHIDEKKISVDEDGKIDVSELERVYPGKLKTPEQLNRPSNKLVEHTGTQSIRLEEEVKRLRSELETLQTERRRERDQLEDQISTLKSSLEKSMSQNEGLTRLLTDQRSETEKLADDKKSSQEAALERVLSVVQEINEKQNQGNRWWPFGGKRKAG